MAMISQIEPKNINEAMCEESWVNAIEEELSQFESVGTRVFHKSPIEF